ncbi:CD5 antigen-like [Oreochromis aureus]|uniref:CD5 antigen-like n=1 Tax=Oreochromis aureus TaxID=47969 RepID=UPI001954E95C|nr:CD5 antigen-like [Oreochromis aureus]
MDPLLLLMVLLWSSGVQAEEKHDSTEFARLVRGASRCAGTLEIKHLGEWRPVDMSDWTLKTSAVFCEHLDCGSAVSVEERKESAGRSVWMINSDCAQSGAALGECVISGSSSSIVDFTCSGDSMIGSNVPG